MHKLIEFRWPVAMVLAGLIVLSLDAVRAQYAVRPDDPLGLSIRTPRVRIVHSRTPEVPGTSMHLQQAHPWLAYQLGRAYFFREWGGADGAFTSLPKRPEGAVANSCGMCHNAPFPSAGSGGNVGIEVGAGRTASHLFGAGLIETLGIQVRAQILAAHDANDNGFLDFPAETRGRRAVVEATAGTTVDFGSLDDGDVDGYPDLNPALMVRMVDALGNRTLFNEQGGRARLTDTGIVGYDLAVGAFASSAGDHQFASMRTFSSGVFVTIFGILPEGRTTPIRPEKVSGGRLKRDWGRFTNAGAFQSELMLPGGRSDAGGEHGATVSDGELDLLEWYLLNHPSPAVGPQDARTQRGRALLDRLGCTSCHVPRWSILPEDRSRGLPGDRRFFDLAVSHNPNRGRFEGRLVHLTQAQGRDSDTLYLPRRAGFEVRDVFTDLRHHDLGARFWENFYAEGRLYVTKRFRTAPLWGVSSTGPYGHDGASLTLDDVIRRHGGEAEAAARAYASSPDNDRQAVIAYLRSLSLYSPDRLPTDLDGDGRIEETFRVRDVELGPEVFRPELLFRVPARYRGWVESADGRFFSYELLNSTEAYGGNLVALKDSDNDGVPDIAEGGGGAVRE
jgi:hypothetical protein